MKKKSLQRKGVCIAGIIAVILIVGTVIWTICHYRTSATDIETVSTNDAPEVIEVVFAQNESQFVDENGNVLFQTGTNRGMPPEEEMQEETPTDYWGYTNLGIANVSNHLNIRKEPNENGEMVGKMSNNAACEIISIDENGWAYVTSGDIEGYVSTDYLLMGEEAIARGREVVTVIATVNTTTLKVREEPNTDCAVITLVPIGEKLEVTAQEGDWVEIDLDGDVAYVSAEYVDLEEQLFTAISMQELMYGNGISDVRISLCQFAKQYIGNPYVWGGVSLTNGADCSGFVLSVYAHYGISLPHSSRAQANCGRTISLSEVKPGDLIFYTKGGVINHVAIYIGNGQVVHASSPRTGIRVSNMYYRTPYKAVSLL
ncbi:MAG: NlpC/P60 family protein [Lachnospiraceae bacterium]